MKLKSYHWALFKANLYKLIATPGILNDQDIIDVLDEVLGELTEGEKNA